MTITSRPMRDDDYATDMARYAAARKRVRVKLSIEGGDRGVWVEIGSDVLDASIEDAVKRHIEPAIAALKQKWAARDERG